MQKNLEGKKLFLPLKCLHFNAKALQEKRDLLASIYVNGIHGEENTL